ncbi:hypothetical protein NODU109028_12440 [Nocardioides dubius]|uniref:WD40 repeat domain-containing protein n=1 Tax=Nocardioides dubius TaxID=317019 RepID=A0ABP4EC31_9ACTN
MLAAAALAVPFVLGALAAPAPVDADVAFAFADPEILESSGLVVGERYAVTVNDSGDEARIFTVDVATGETVGVTRWEGEARDVEALAPASENEVWVGDIGDNLEARDSVRVTRVPFGAGDRTVAGVGYDLTFPGGARDAEALLSDPVTGRLYVVSKHVLGGTIYAAPEVLDAERPNRLVEVGEAPGLITDAAFFPDGRHVVMRNYGQGILFAVDADGWRELGTFALPPQQQGEGIAVSPDGWIHLSSEGAEAEVLRIELPDDLATEVPRPTTDADADAPARSAADDTTLRPERDPWPWVLGSIFAVLAMVVLVRSLRPR